MYDTLNSNFFDHDILVNRSSPAILFVDHSSSNTLQPNMELNEAKGDLSFLIFCMGRILTGRIMWGHR